MKKVISILVMTLVLASMALPAFADQAAPEITLEENAFSLSDAGVAMLMLAGGIDDGYNAHVLSEMVGRSGAYTVSGTKGIAFEVLFKDQMNLKSIFESGTHYSLSQSSTDAIADVVKTSPSGIEYFQLKSGTSAAQIRDIFNRVTNGSYPDTELVGTSECAKAFNEYAEAHGADIRMTDSHISEKMAEKSGKQFLGITLNGTALLRECSKSGAVAAIIGMLSAGIDSLIRKLPWAASVARIMTEGATDYIAFFIKPLVKKGVGVLFNVAGVAGSAAAPWAAAAAILVSIAARFGINKLNEYYNMEETLTVWIDEAGNRIVVFTGEVEDWFNSVDWEKYGDDIVTFFSETGTCIARNASAAGEWICETSGKVWDATCSAAETAYDATRGFAVRTADSAVALWNRVMN